MIEPATTLTDLGIGLIAGIVGGLAGIGGSIVMLPALAFFHGYRTPDDEEHQIYMAASMLVNIAVSLSSTLKHTQKGVSERGIVLWLGAAMSAGIVGGAIASTNVEGELAKLALAVFIWLYCLYTVFTLVRRLPDPPADRRPPRRRLLVGIGLGVGMLAGFLGVGGGILLVPLLQVVGLPLRRAIVVSAGVMWISAAVGATTKLLAIHASEHLAGLGLTPRDAVAIAAPMGAGALAGGFIGAGLGHSLKTPALKIAIVVILSLAAARMVF